jgi:uncharacterized protein (DUF1778 family)
MPNLAVSRAPRRQRRLSLRATDEERSLIEQAALLSTSGDVTSFVMRATVEAARETIERHERTRVTDEMRRAFYDLLLSPPPPGSALRKLAARPVPEGYELVDE